MLLCRRLIESVQSLLLGALGVTAFASISSAQEDRHVIRIDATSPRQTIDGFGASGCWWSNAVDGWPAGKLDRALDLLYTDKGINLSIYRHNIGAGGGTEIGDPFRRGVNVETEPGVYDLSRDATSMRVLRGVRERGVENVVVFSNSPPARLTKNGLVSGGEGGGENLAPENEDAFVTWVVDIAELIRKDVGLEEIYLSPVNEPQWKWGKDWRGQEGCHYTPQQTASIIRKAIDTVNSRGLPIRVEAPDAGAWGGETPNYVRHLLADPVIREHLDAVAVHSYWSRPGDRKPLADLVQELAPGMKLSMTEFCEMRWTRGLDIDAGLHLAAVLADDFTLGEVSGWTWWLGVSLYDYRDGLLYSIDNEIVESKRFWILGNYSKFVRPGAVRVGASEELPQFRIVSFVSADRRQLICVATNFGDESKPFQVEIDGAEIAGPARVFVTDETRSLEEIPSAGESVAPARSVSTHVFDLTKPPAWAE